MICNADVSTNISMFKVRRVSAHWLCGLSFTGRKGVIRERFGVNVELNKEE